MLELLEPKVLFTLIRLAELNKNDTVASTEEANGGLDKVVTQMINARTDYAPVPRLFYGESHYGDLIKRRVKLEDYSFPATDTTGTQVRRSIDLFADYLIQASAAGLGDKLSNQMFFNGTLKLTITMQGAPQAYGQLVFFAVPTPRQTGENLAARICGFGMVKAKTFPHVVMDPSKACTCELSLPCPTPAGVWTRTDGTADQANSYSLYSIVYNPLGSGTSTTIAAVEGTIYVSFEDMVPGPVTLLSDSLAENEEKGGPLSGPATAVAKAADALSVVPVIGPYMTITSSVASGASTFLKWLGFSRPYESNPNQIVTNKTTTTYGAFNTKSYHTPLATDAAAGISLSPAYSGGGSLDDMDIAKICAKKSIIATFGFTPSTSNGFLWSARVHPTLSYSPVVDMYELSNLGFMALPYVYWHGSISFTFEIVCSTFHRAVIGIAYDPGPAVANNWETAVQTLKTQIVTVSGNTVVEFEVPWQQPHPFGVVRRPQDTDITPGNGHISFFLLSPLESNGSVDAIGVNVYTHSNDMKFAVPDISAVSDQQILTTSVGTEDGLTMLSDGVTFLSDSLNDDGCELIGVEVPDHFGRSNNDDFFMRFFGEDVAVSTKKTASKLAPVMFADFHDVAHQNTIYDYVINFQIKPRFVGDSLPKLQVTNNYYSWYALGYKGVRGSVNLSMVPLKGGPTTTGINTMWLTLFSKDQSAITNRDAFPFSRNQSIGYPELHPTNDVSVPHYAGAGYFYPTSMIADYGGPGAAYGHSGSDGTFWCLSSLGDDGMFINYLGPPVIIDEVPI